jgi:hypothetical protein
MQTATSASKRLGLSAVAFAAAAGCYSNYHPEYHPETRYTVVQNVTYPTTVVRAVAPAGSGAFRSTTASSSSVPPPVRVVRYVSGP